VSRAKLLILIGGGALLFLLLLIVVIAMFSSRGTAPSLPTEKVTLQFWGLFDDNDVYQPIIDAYQKLHPNVTIEYRKFLWDDYESSLINALAARRGPDILMVHNSWLPKHADKLAPAPQTVSSAYEAGFLHATRRDVTSGGKLYVLPLFIDNLALFYNRDILAQEGFSNPPLTWGQFKEYVNALKRFSPDGILTRSGAALGSSSKSINRASDILLFLFFQNGVQPLNPQTRTVPWKADPQALDRAKNALLFYTSFADPSQQVYTWNDKQLYSIDAFFSGKVAMMFNYAYNIPVIKSKAPYLNFGVASLPVKEGDSYGRVTIGNYWGAGVSNASKQQPLAWDFLQFMTSAQEYPLYIAATGRLSARVDALEKQKDDPLFKPFIDQSDFMVTPYQQDERKMQDIFDEMITSVNARIASPEQALRKAQDRLELLVQ